jgi:hypothetical protein
LFNSCLKISQIYTLCCTRDIDVKLGSITMRSVKESRRTTFFLSFFLSCFLFNLCGGTWDTAATTGLLYQPRMMDDGDCGEICGMKIGRGNRSTQRKPSPASICRPQIPHDQTRFWTRAAAEFHSKPHTFEINTVQNYTTFFPALN